jgi:hypothetical protein
MALAPSHDKVPLRFSDGSAIVDHHAWGSFGYSGDAMAQRIPFGRGC